MSDARDPAPVPDITDLEIAVQRVGSLSRQFALADADYLVRLQDVAYKPEGAERPILSNVTFDVRAGDRLFLLGARGTGKSVLVKLITGELAPTSGVVRRRGRMSFPLGQLPFYVPTAPLEEYVRYVAKSYGGDADEVWTYFENLAMPIYDPSRPIGRLLAKDRQVLSVIVGLLIPFDLYVLDDYSPFLSTSGELASILEQRSQAGTVVFSTRMANGVRSHATRIGVIASGYVSVFDTFLDGLRAFREVTAMSGQPGMANRRP